MKSTSQRRELCLSIIELLLSTTEKQRQAPFEKENKFQNALSLIEAGPLLQPMQCLRIIRPGNRRRDQRGRI
jgi:hypothetical protein